MLQLEITGQNFPQYLILVHTFFLFPVLICFQLSETKCWIIHLDTCMLLIFIVYYSVGRVSSHTWVDGVSVKGVNIVVVWVPTPIYIKHFIFVVL